MQGGAQGVKRPFYLAALLVALPAVGFAWWLNQDQPYVRYTYPLLMGAFCFWSWRLWAGARPERIEREVILAVGLLFLGKLAYGFSSGLELEHAEIESAYWVLAFVMVLVYLSFSPRQGLWIALGMVGLTSALGLWFGRGRTSLELLSFLRNETRLLAMAGLLYLLAAVKDRLTQMNRRVEEMHTLARTDPLTGLPNRLALSERLEAEVQAPRGLFLVLLDVDHFKQINDRYGHAVGDAVLREVACRLRVGLREGDVLGRWGGEEFLILLREESLQNALAVLERVREGIAFWPFEAVGFISASFGVAEAHSGDTVRSLLERADRALYQAKRGGRNRVEPA
ncbi:MAG: GGDEF domain-containing protein [Meiothermus sp.]|uniref:GGDEF domain-containing protein n=2 Tax=Meiothermus sp. TaxID=1955249 RepID=UPI002601D8C4|nr:GGDEF domain-containing protein [Meiothermus sp.]MCS7058567.1 GGDEF domain-containing protein [Meiothermus sp.]